jgi:hypothetical protein
VRRVFGLGCMLIAVVARPASPADTETPTPPPAVPAPPANPATAPAPAPAPATPPPSPQASTDKNAARLALVGRTREHLIYIDKPTLRKLTNDKFELWAEVHADDGERVKFLMQLNCSDRSYVVKSEVVYNSDGEVVENNSHPAPAIQYVVPDSASEFIHEAICRGS